MNEKTIIEVNGVKLEVDMRYARRIEEIRIGDKVKVLKKQYGESFAVVPGIIVGFEPFKQLPTIVVAYVESDWSKAEIKFLHYNSGVKDVEIVHAADEDFHVDRDALIARLDDWYVYFVGSDIRQMLGEITRLSTALEEARGAWLPIESAPKDGTTILVCGTSYMGDYYVTDVKWLHDEWMMFDPTSDDYTVDTVGHTHWRPLPDPPALPAAKEKEQKEETKAYRTRERVLRRR